jgi:GTP-binding protein
VELGATDAQLDFPIVYGMAKRGIAQRSLEEESQDLTPLFELITQHVNPYPNTDSEPLQLQVSSLAYDDYIGRLGIGRIHRGTFELNKMYKLSTRDGAIKQVKASKLFIHEGLKKVEVTKAFAGDMVIFAGMSDISIGETICDMNHVEPLPMIDIEKPTLQMLFLVSDSPFVGRSGKLVTTRHLRARLFKELETNVGLIVEPLDHVEGFKVSGRGELHLSILLENMRREGYELCVSKPEVLYQEIDGVKHEPYEKVYITAPDTVIGTVINALNQRKGMMQDLISDMGYTKMRYLVPTRGLIGYRSEFITSTKGEGTMEKSFDSYQPYAGPIESYRNGVFIAKESGKTMAYSLWKLSERGVMCVEPAVDVYEGMIVGIHARDNDLVVNPCKNKQLTNVRSSGADDAIALQNPKTFTLEEALEFIEDDELVEVTPDAIRLRKKILIENERKRSYKEMQY